MNTLISEFLPLAVAHLIALVIPGPDFAIVLKQSMQYGKKTGIYTSLGIGAAITIHVTLGLMGASILIAQSEVAFSILQYAGAAYLLFLGLRSIKACKTSPKKISSQELPNLIKGKAFATGFLTNALNPKVTVFCLSLFSVIIQPSTSNIARIGYAAYMSLSTVLWFSLVATAIGNKHLKGFFYTYGHVLERCMGIVFIALGIRIAVSGLN